MDHYGKRNQPAQKRAEREAEGQMNIAQLLSAPKKQIKEAESK